MGPLQKTSVTLHQDGCGARQPLTGGETERLGAAVKIGRKRSRLVKELRADPPLGPFLSIQSKENGFDAAGLMASGERLVAGPRGPVLRGRVGAGTEFSPKQ
ncbi:MAG: DUF3616 domain-containing protein [Rhodospirillales bacterium]|nr:DUF3616 domain-containing protein [Rhodospirillales bacterium]